MCRLWRPSWWPLVTVQCWWLAPLVESALSPFSCWPTSATMYAALLQAPMFLYSSLLFKPVVESALSPFSCWPTSATMYDALASSTSRLPLSLYCSSLPPLVQASGGINSVGNLLLAHVSAKLCAAHVTLNLQASVFWPKVRPHN